MRELGRQQVKCMCTVPGCEVDFAAKHMFQVSPLSSKPGAVMTTNVRLSGTSVPTDFIRSEDFCTNSQAKYVALAALMK